MLLHPGLILLLFVYVFGARWAPVSAATGGPLRATSPTSCPGSC